MKINYPALSPKSYQALFALEQAMAPAIFERKLFDLVRIRCSQINACLMCVDLHTKEAKSRKETQLRLYHLAFWRESALFTEKEKAALNWAESVTLIAQGHTVDQSLDLMKKHFTDQEISDLTFCIGSINMWNRFGVAFKPEPGSMDKMFKLDQLDLS